MRTSGSPKRHSTSDVISRDQRLIAVAEKIRFYPLSVVAGDGCWVRDADGRRLLDFTAGWAVANTGYRDPVVREAVVRELDAGWFAGVTSAAIPSTVELADRLLQITPTQQQSKVWFGHSGSDANEAAARLVTRATGRRRTVSFIGSYHGSTDGSAAMSGHTAQARFAGSPTNTKIPYPDAFRPTMGSSASENEQSILRYLDEQILESVSPRADTAAVWVEAIQSDGGDLAPSPRFLAGLEEICRRSGILLVLDEVKVGMGRTGDWFAYEESGVRPDVVVLGKALGGGMPLSAVIAPEAVLDSDAAIALFTTAGGAVATAAGLAAIDSIEQRRLRENATRVGQHLEGELRALSNHHELVGDVRGRGLMLGVELVRNRETLEPAASETAKVVFRAWELGLVLFYVGLRSNVLEVTPPLPLTEELASRGVEILDQALTDVEAGRVTDDDIAEYAGW